MAEKNKVCWNCGNFKAYYEKGFSRFYKTHEGLCSVKNQIIDKHGNCECWRNAHKLWNLRKKCAVRVLNEILLELAAIRQILEEEKEENKSDPIK